MNEFTAKKLGEVYAFIKVGGDQFKRSRAALASVMAEVELERVTQTYVEHLQGMGEVLQTAPLTAIITATAEVTGDKLLAMAQVYMNKESDWDDTSEVLEWLGFFEGGAIIHLALVESAARELELGELSTLVGAAADFHRSLLAEIEIAIAALVRSKALTS
ncbi:MAG: hypothetical protein A2589_00835 [Candidatus Vogelbacteria bacterium RIFOXYD1_FULL_46_19]|uniref:Uncharacterized protein n=1 Tax=Candidatus Vogelbacteria bacterium RIFOXYD1_FULL_46_19 TaxID=1802439 RepID=A0A1G2QFL2_9BACT|nr:MAG: hypothetical protein A2589_00835 [Candidatus Vogelbacteria bacterium RIFOXYD1_FULL_46_19]